MIPASRSAATVTRKRRSARLSALALSSSPVEEVNDQSNANMNISQSACDHGGESHRRGRRSKSSKIESSQDISHRLCTQTSQRKNSQRDVSRKKPDMVVNTTKIAKQSFAKSVGITDAISAKNVKKSIRRYTNRAALKNKCQENDCLPRTWEVEAKESKTDSTKVLHVIGVDEAGRGPLAGPVVAAAVIVPQDIPGVTDSKKLKEERKREELYEKIITSPNVKWAVAVVDAKRIDEINILQATLEGMRSAVQSLLVFPPSIKSGGQRVEKVSASLTGSYVACGWNDSNGVPLSFNQCTKIDECSEMYRAIIDGNRLPKDMPCESDTMIKGDSREFSIAAASILAKVTRDRLMHEYDVLYPKYNLTKHKGYPTALHISKVKEFGASPIHRRSFAPLKYMEFDVNGNILDKSKESK